MWRVKRVGRTLTCLKEGAVEDASLDDAASDVEYDDVYDETEGEYDEGSDVATDSEYEEEDETTASAFDYNSRGELMIPNLTRLSRMRVSHNRHKLFKGGNLVHLSNLVYPLVVHDKVRNKRSICYMIVRNLPCLSRMSQDFGCYLFQT